MTPKTAEVLKAFRTEPEPLASPLKIMIMLACHVSPYPENMIPTGLWISPAAKVVVRELFDADLVDEHQRPTARGKAWVDYICNTPLPVSGGWVLPEREAVEP